VSQLFGQSLNRRESRKDEKTNQNWQLTAAWAEAEVSSSGSDVLAGPLRTRLAGGRVEDLEERGERGETPISSQTSWTRSKGNSQDIPWTPTRGHERAAAGLREKGRKAKWAASPWRGEKSETHLSVEGSSPRLMMYVGSTWEMMMVRTMVTIKMAKTRYGSSWLELPRSRNVSEMMRAIDVLQSKGWKRQHAQSRKGGTG
jgi:hypothetical protein